MQRVLRVIFSKAESGETYTEVARGTWRVGTEPSLTGEPIPPEVLTGLEVQIKATADRKGTLTHDRTDVRYAMDFEEV